MFFVRKEKSPKELIEDIRGYGHTFPESHTTWEADVRGSVSHQRIIRYSFGGMCVVVRSETDGYLDDQKRPGPSNVAKLTQPIGDAGDDFGLSSSLDVSERTVNSDEPLMIKPGGQLVPQQLIFDIKTRSSRKEIDMDDVLPRLWVNQTPNFIIAYHKSGDFSDPQIQHVRPKILAWEAANAKVLGRLQAILRDIKDQANSLDLNSFEISRTGTGPLHLRKQVGDNKRAMPSALSADWKLRGSRAASNKGDADVASVGSEDSTKSSHNLSDEESEESEKDFTACSLDDCGYCGHCTY